MKMGESESKILKEMGSFFGKVERALFEIITWVVFVPRTIYWVLAYPKQIPGYVRDELSDDQPETFQNSISPVFLYLLAAVGPFLLMQIYALPSLPVDGSSQSAVDSTSTFSVTVPGGRRGDMMVQWSVARGTDTLPPLRQCYVEDDLALDCTDAASTMFEIEV